MKKIVRYYCDECGREIVPTYEPQPPFENEMPFFDHKCVFKVGKDEKYWICEWEDRDTCNIKQIYLSSEGGASFYNKQGWKQKIYILQKEEWSIKRFALRQGEEEKDYIVTPFIKGYRHMGIEYEMEMEDEMIFKCSCGCEYKSIWDLVERKGVE